MFKVKGDKTADVEFSLRAKDGNIILQANGIDILYIDGDDGTLNTCYIEDRECAALSKLKLIDNELAT